jgi:hypothetical protein
VHTLLSSLQTPNASTLPKVNLRDALLRTISYDAPNGKAYRLRPEAELATLLVRCGGPLLLGPRARAAGPCSGRWTARRPALGCAARARP